MSKVAFVGFGEVNTPIDINMLTTEGVNIELDKGYVDMVEGKIISAKQAFSNIRKE